MVFVADSGQNPDDQTRAAMPLPLGFRRGRLATPSNWRWLVKFNHVSNTPIAPGPVGDHSTSSALLKVALAFRDTLRPKIDRFEHGYPEQLSAVSELLNIPIEALEIADKLGYLRFGDWFGAAVVAMTDSAGHFCKLLRLDGLPFPPFASLPQRHCHILKNSLARWMLGILDSAAYSHIAVVFGETDFFTALALGSGIHPFFPAALLNGQGAIFPELFELFQNKTVRILPPIDAKGLAYIASANLQTKILGAGASHCDFYDFGGLEKFGGHVKNLNEFFHWQNSPNFPADEDVASLLMPGLVDVASPVIVDNVCDLALVRDGRIKLPVFYAKPASQVDKTAKDVAAV
jgi:hypothetical protein